MAAADPQPMDTSLTSAPESSSSVPRPTISSEEDEQAAESGIAVKVEEDEDASATAIDEPEGDADDKDGIKVEEEVVDPNRLPDDACETLYLQNLNERVRLPGKLTAFLCRSRKLTKSVLKETLASLFKPYRPLLPVVAHRNVRMRGQAFVSFADKEAAHQAKKDVSEFPLYGKAIQVSFAQRRADSVVQKLETAEELDEHLKRRKDEKKKKRRDNPLRRKELEKRKQVVETEEQPVQKKQRLQMPDEYLPPNNVLFLQNLPEGTTSDDLREVFELHAGLVEIRTIPAKKDIAFVEYSDEAAATVAKEALHNFKIDGETKMKVTYARK